MSSCKLPAATESKSYAGCLCLGKTKTIGFSISFHKSHESVPSVGACHDVGRFNGLGLSIGKSRIHLSSADFPLFVNHEHASDFSRRLCAGIEAVGIVKSESGNTRGSITGAGQFDIGNVLFFQPSDELDGGVQFSGEASSRRDRSKGSSQRSSGEDGEELHCGKEK